MGLWEKGKYISAAQQKAENRKKKDVSTAAFEAKFGSGGGTETAEQFEARFGSGGGTETAEQFEARFDGKKSKNKPLDLVSALKKMKPGDTLDPSDLKAVEDFEKKESKTRAVWDWKGKALGIITSGGDILKTAPNDIVEAARSKVSNTATRGFESVSNAPGQFLKSLSSGLGDMDIGDITDVVEGKKKIGDVLGNVLKVAKNTASYDVKSSFNDIKNLPDDAKKGLKNIPKQVKREIDLKKHQLKQLPQDARLSVDRQMQQVKNTNLRELAGKAMGNDISESNVRSPLADNARQNAVQEELNRAQASIKTSDKLGKSIKESGESSSKAMTNIMSSVTNNISNRVGGSGGGGNASMKPSPFWKDIDQILAGNTI